MLVHQKNPVGLNTFVLLKENFLLFRAIRQLLTKCMNKIQSKGKKIKKLDKRFIPTATISTCTSV